MKKIEIAVPLESPKYTLKLVSHGKRKRTEEAKAQLKEIYPFEIKSENILILKTNKKNIYDVYISKEKINTKKNVAKCILIILTSVVVLSLFIFIAVYKAKVEKTKRLAEKEIEEKIIDEEKNKKAKEKELLVLEKEFAELKANQEEKIYPLIECIYYVIGNKTKVKDISIKGLDFSVVLESKDSVKILRNFENNTAFENVQMTRTTVDDEKENAIYVGKFLRQIKEPEEFYSVEEKIDFYKKEISKIEERKEKQANEKLSEYIKKIRENLRKNNCTEQYIQVKSAEKSAEVEIFAISKSVNILRFIKNLQAEKENLFDIKSISLRSSEQSENVQVFIVFKTGIKLDKENIAKETENKEYSPDTVAKIFYSGSKKETAQVNTKKTSVSKEKNKSVSVKRKTLSYVGLSRIGGKTTIIAKDLDMGSIYRLKLSEKETDGDFCIEKGNGYEARIKNEYYEVRK